MIINQVGGSNFKPVLQLITESGDYTIPYSGTYRIAAVGHGGHGAYESWGDNYSTYRSSGGAGGMGYLDVYLHSGAVLTMTITSSVSKVTLNGADLISATAGSSSVSYSDKKCLAGTVSGDGVIAAPSNGQPTADITPPDAFNSPIYKSTGGYGGAVKGTSNIELGSKDGGDGLFGGDGPDGGMCFYNQNDYVGVAPAKAPTRGAGAADSGAAPYYNGSTYPYGGAGGGAGYGGGGGAIERYRSYAGDYFAVGSGGEGGAGCVRIERIK